MKKALKLSIALIVLVVALQPCAFAALEYAFQEKPIRIEVDDGWALFVCEEGEIIPVYTSKVIVDAFGFENREAFNRFWVDAYKISPDFGYEQAMIMFESESKIYGVTIYSATRDKGENYEYLIDSFNFLKTLPHTKEADFFWEVYQASRNEFIGTCTADTLYVSYITTYNDEIYSITFECLSAVLNSVSGEYDYDYMANIDEISEIAHGILDHIWIGDSRN